MSGEPRAESGEPKTRGVRDFRDLLIWQRAMDLALCVYKLTQNFPADERYGLTSQIRRSAVSIASNIAEGKGRETDGDFARFIRIARGSLAELQTQLFLSAQLGFASATASEEAHRIAEELGRMLRGMQKTLD